MSDGRSTEELRKIVTLTLHISDEALRDGELRAAEDAVCELSRRSADADTMREALGAVIPYMEELLQLKKYHIKNDVHAHIVFRDAVAALIKAGGQV